MAFANTAPSHPMADDFVHRAEQKRKHPMGQYMKPKKCKVFASYALCLRWQD
jgi:hypothetical protein